MTTMLRTSTFRSVLSNSRNGSSSNGSRVNKIVRMTFATQSNDDAKKSDKLATLYLEDGTVLTGRSFGHHSSVEGEVCTNQKNREK